MNWGIIGVNVAVFILELLYTGNLSDYATQLLFVNYGLVPYYILAAVNGVEPIRFLTLISSMFLHAGIIHIFGNMLYLFVFGDNVEDRLGRPEYVLFFLLAGVAGGLTQVYLSLLSGPPDIFVPSVGASAAISGVLAVYLVLFPRARVISIIGYFVIPIRAVWFIGGWFFLQLIYASLGVDTGVAYPAHIGGFAFGLFVGLLVRLTRPRGYDD